MIIDSTVDGECGKKPKHVSVGVNQIQFQILQCCAWE